MKKLIVPLKSRILNPAILAMAVLVGVLSISPIESASATEGGSEKICFFLGDDRKPSILDQDIFEFYGTKGEKVTITLEMDSSGSHTGKQANLSLMDEITRTWLFRTTTGSLPRTIAAVLPATGKYLILVAELPRLGRLDSFRGTYCLTLASSVEAYASLTPTRWVEPKENRAPAANAGSDQTIYLNQTVTLDGSGSSDMDGDPLTYTWSLISVPSGSTAALSDPSAVKPTFIANRAGTYVAQLIVSDGEVDSGPDMTNVTVVSVGPQIIVDEQNNVSSFISPDGGELSTTGRDGTRFILTFPAGSLPQPQEITLAPALSVSGLPLEGTVLAAVHMGPSGLRLLNPAILTIELPLTAPTNELVGFLIQNNGEGFHLYPIAINGNSVSFQLFHFTIGGVAPGSCIDVNALNNAIGLTPEQLAQNQMAILEENISRCQSAIDVDEVLGTIRDIHYDWFYGEAGISGLINQAQSDPDTFLERAISQLNSWYFSLAYNGLVPGAPGLFEFTIPFECGHPGGHLCSDLNDVAEAAGAAIFQAFRVAVTSANDTCRAGGQNQDAKALEWIDLADSLPLSGFYPFYQDSRVWDIEELLQLKTCGIRNIEIEPVSGCLVIGQTATLRVIGKDISGNSIALGDPPLPFRGINFERYVNLGVVDISRPANDLIMVTAINEGTAQIKVGIALSGGTVAYEATATITVNKPEVTVTPSQAAIAVCNPIQLTATVKDCLGNPYAGCILSWYSSNVDVAEVDASGLVTPKHRGQANITAACGDSIGVAAVTVKGFTGVWEDNYGETLRITVNPPLAEGTYSSYWDFCGGMVNGSINGQVSGGGCVLTGKWADNGGAQKIGDGPWQCFVGESGTFRFELSSDGDSFTGSHTYLCFAGECGDYGSFPWNGVRRPPSP